MLLSGLWPTSSCTRPRRPRSRRSTSAGSVENNLTLYLLYLNLHRARAGAENAAAALQRVRRWRPTRIPAIAEMLSLAGFTYVYLARDFCSGVPFSRPGGRRGRVRRRRRPPRRLSRRARGAVRCRSRPAWLTVRSAGDHQSRLGGQGPALLNLDGSREARPRLPSGADRVSVRHRARRQPAPAAERDLGLQRRVPLVGRRIRKAAWLPYRTADDPRVPFVDDEETTRAGQTTPQFTLLKYPDSDIAGGGGRRDRGSADRGRGGSSRRAISGNDHDPQRPPRRPGPRPAGQPGTQDDARSTCSSASGPSGSSPPDTGWATCGG